MDFEGSGEEPKEIPQDPPVGENVVEELVEENVTEEVVEEGVVEETVHVEEMEEEENLEEIIDEEDKILVEEIQDEEEDKDEGDLEDEAETIEIEKDNEVDDNGRESQTVEEKKVTLAEKISAASVSSRNDSLGNSDNEGLNAAIGNKKIDDIRQAISLGDRFRFQRELFNNNGEEMNKTLSYINMLATYKADRFSNRNTPGRKTIRQLEIFISLSNVSFKMKLYVVPTPIRNLEDMTWGCQVLKEVVDIG